MSILAVDIGNTSTALGLFDGSDVMSARVEIPTRILRHREMTLESLESPLRGITSPETIGIASVVPWASDEIIVVLHELFPDATILIMTSTNVPMAIDYPHPEELGIDRLLGALAARSICPAKTPCIVIDMGTATTYDCIAADGTYLGGAIAAGVELAASALTAKAAQLPPIELMFPSSIIGRTTIESMQSGALFGALAQVEGMIGRLAIAAFNGDAPYVVATGGLAKLLVGHTSKIDRFEPDLILMGVRIAAELAEPVAS